MKWALVAILTLGSLGAWAMSVMSARELSGDVKPMQLPRVAMRALPPLSGGPIAVAAPAPKEIAKAAPKETPKEEAPKDELEALPPPKPQPVAAKVEPKAEPKPEPKPEVKVAMRDPAPAPAPKPAPQPKPAPVEEAPAPDPAPKPQPEEKTSAAPPAAAASGEGTLNLKASDTAEVVVDGRKLGPSPKLGLKLKAGKHKIRFDCYDENGNLKAGKIQNVEVVADEEKDVDYECPFTQ